MSMDRTIKQWSRLYVEINKVAAPKISEVGGGWATVYDGSNKSVREFNLQAEIVEMENKIRSEISTKIKISSDLAMVKLEQVKSLLSSQDFDSARAELIKLLDLIVEASVRSSELRIRENIDLK